MVIESDSCVKLTEKFTHGDEQPEEHERLLNGLFPVDSLEQKKRKVQQKIIKYYS